MVSGLGMSTQLENGILHNGQPLWCSVNSLGMCSSCEDIWTWTCSLRCKLLITFSATISEMLKAEQRVMLKILLHYSPLWVTLFCDAFGILRNCKGYMKTDAGCLNKLTAHYG